MIFASAEKRRCRIHSHLYLQGTNEFHHLFPSAQSVQEKQIEVDLHTPDSHMLKSSGFLLSGLQEAPDEKPLVDTGKFPPVFMASKT